jgi:hypothetical protein
MSPDRPKWLLFKKKQLSTADLIDLKIPERPDKKIKISFVCVVLCRPLFVFLSFSFGHCIVSPPVYGSWLPLWYLQTFLSNSWSQKQTRLSCKCGVQILFSSISWISKTTSGSWQFPAKWNSICNLYWMCRELITSAK